MAKKSTKKKSDFDFDTAQKMTAAEISKYMDERERRFAVEYLLDMNGTQAAIRAGYSPGKDNASAAVQASRLLRDPRVRAYRSALIRESVEDMDVSRESVLLKLLEIYQRCMAAKPVLEYKKDEGWVPSGVWQFDARGAAKALEQICKLLGLDAPVKHNVESEGIEKFFRQFGEERSY